MKGLGRQAPARIELYEVDNQGGVTPLVVSERTGPVGGFGGMLQSAHEETRQTGVVSYGWSPDGTALWYARLRLRTPAEREAVTNTGVVYRSSTMSSLAFNKDMTAMVGTELRLWRPKEDRLLTHAPANAMDDFMRFSRDSVSWSSDGQRLQYAESETAEGGQRDHDGLVMFPTSPANAAWSKRRDHFSNCVFARDLKYGACVRETLTEPQELVAISPDRGEVKAIARPNAAFDAIEPLRSERLEWTGKSGGVSDGYVTYPRGFVKGKKYPVMVVTHGGDARNRFAYYGFQAEAPVQVFAESGYVVLSVNDPMVNARTRESSNKFLHTDGDADVEAMQFYKNIQPWSMGADSYIGLYQGMFGGSAYDPHAVENYRKYSAVFRAKQFSGAMLQQSAARSGMFGLELHIMLRQAKVPNEFVFFPEESHIFWHPQRRAAAMNRSLDWFNYWLLDERDSSPDKKDQYARWDAMAAEWRAAGRDSGS